MKERQLKLDEVVAEGREGGRGGGFYDSASGSGAISLSPTSADLSALVDFLLGSGGVVNPLRVVAPPRPLRKKEREREKLRIACNGLRDAQTLFKSKNLARVPSFRIGVQEVAITG